MNALVVTCVVGPLLVLAMLVRSIMRPDVIAVVRVALVTFVVLLVVTMVGCAPR